MSRYELMREMCRRTGLHAWYGSKLLANIILFEARTGKRVSNATLAIAIKYLNDNRQYLVPVGG